MNLLSKSEDDASMQILIMVFGLIEICIGLAGVVVADFLPTFSVLTVLSGTAGMLAMAFFISHPANVKIYDILGMALVFAYGTGTLFSLFSFAGEHYDLLAK